jgi:hypothetical protein
MLKRVSTIVLCGLLFETMLAADAWALQPVRPIASRQAARVQNAVERIGTGTNALVAVRLRDKSVVSGWIKDVGVDSFRVVEPQTGTVLRKVGIAGRDISSCFFWTQMDARLGE